MRYRVLMHVEVEARDNAHARDQAKNLGELFKKELLTDLAVRMRLASVGVSLVDGSSMVYDPQKVAI